MKKNSLKKNEVCKLHPWEVIPCPECKLEEAKNKKDKRKIVFDRIEDDPERFDMFDEADKYDEQVLEEPDDD